MSAAADPEEDALGKAYDGRLLRRFLVYLRPYRPAIGVLALFLTLRVGADVAGPLILKEAIDGPVARGDLDGLAGLALLFGAAILATGLFEFGYSWMMNCVGQGVLLDLRMQVFGHLQRLSVSFFDRNPVGRLVVRVTNDIETLHELFTSGLVEFAADLLMLAGVTAVMFFIDWRLALVTMAVTPFVVGAALFFRRVARERNREVRKRVAQLNSCLNECVSGMRTIQIFGREKPVLEKFRGFNADYRDSTVAAIFSYSLFYPGIEILSYAAVALLVGYGGLSILGGTLTYGSFFGFWYCAQKFFQPIREIAEKYNILQAAMASSERVFKILDTAPEVADRAGAAPAPALRGEVAFENVSFSYDGVTPVLEDVSFRVEPGRSLAIVGLTGAGKTTIINLLLRFYDPRSGTVRIDGRDVRDDEIRSLRRQMGLVLQDVFLFAGTVEENIRLDEAAVSRERMEETARAVNADRFISRFPKGYATEVMERGALLSTGERQLLSFARALAFDPKVLVLDEATSSVDGATEQLIQEGLLRLMRGRTSIVIAHRLSTIQHADRILVLHKGRVREEGTHAELLAQDGLYRKLHRLQFGPGTAPPPAVVPP